MTDFPLAELKRVVESCVGTDNAAEIEESTLDVELVELGLDSLAVYEVVTRLQDELGITVSDEEIDGLRTPRQVLEFVGGRLATAAG
ncbi:acyl carrier protein [Kutzneria buriramensis]|jgi:acyl carrier protein|uniref:Acyl carrier protein/act minimal PKS acyl carrier protein n=1 Tax=Kutzneria buriramensis TaxID=1045776 RepID=A0A3E0GWP8_9PSEU|nr:acyl carrier protein [Kutzneria buriramensis]REH32553.1 acyl carrier protein/act minimal PKS acyl carrier protein [Kutzneria buriramensis]